MILRGGWCRHVPRLMVIVLSVVLLAANLKTILPQWMQTMVSVMVVLLSLVDVYVLQSNLGRRSFTVTLMCMEIVEATLSLVMLLPHTHGLSRVAISSYLVVNNGIDVFAGFFYEIMAHKLALCVADDEGQHPVYRFLTSTGFKFCFILATLYKIALITSMDFVQASFAVQNVIATLFFFMGVAQISVASLAGGSLLCCPCFRCLRPQDGTIRAYLPVFVVGVVAEIFVSSPLSLGLGFDTPSDFQGSLAGWSVFMALPIIQLLETSMIFRCFALPYHTVSEERPGVPMAVGVSADPDFDVEVAVLEAQEKPKSKRPVAEALGIAASDTTPHAHRA